jgi:hypothetical protein
MVLSPAVCVAEFVAHAQEHLEAAAVGGGHSHEGEHTPHHEHDGDGKPKPENGQTWLCPAARTSFGHVPCSLVLDMQYVGTLADRAGITAAVALHIGREQRLRSPTGPSPGDTLPLLI